MEMKMKKQILQRGYITYALTNEKGEIYGLSKEEGINFNDNKVELEHKFYWSEVYCEPFYMAVIIRKGTLLVKPTAEELSEKYEQSKVNLH